jgi:hypothetical protein
MLCSFGRRPTVLPRGWEIVPINLFAFFALDRSNEYE